MGLTEQQKQYQKAYYQRHKERRLAQNRERRLVDIERYKQKDKRYYEEHRTEILGQKKEYHQANRQGILERMKESYRANRETRLEQAIEYYRVKGKKQKDSIRQEWLEIIKQKGMNVCCHCGYSKCFAAIDFHHVNPEDKKFNIANKLRSKPTTEALAELDKCIALCATCHRELHFNGEF